MSARLGRFGQPPMMPPGGPMPGSPGSPWNASGYKFRTWFVYESDTTAALAPGAAANLTFNIAGDSDFFWTKFNMFALVGGAATVRNADQLPAVTILVTNTTSGRQYSSSAAPAANITGQGNLPFILPMVTLWEAKSTVQIALSNIGNATYSNLYLSFIGIKAFP
jgi:hypothetical protein